MPTIKIHVYRKELGADGLNYCDFTGAGEHGAGVNDQHRTVWESEDPAPHDQILFIQENGPAFNRMLSFLDDAGVSALGGKVADLFRLEGDGPVGLRIGIWDH